MTYVTLYQGSGGRIDIGYELVQNIDTNQTVVNVTAYVVKTNSSYYSYRSSPITFKLTVNGNEKSFGWTFNFSNMNLNQRYAITSHSQTINHNADGTAANVPVSVYCVTSTEGLGTISGSTSIALPTIPRATVPNLSAGITEMGSAVTINTPRASPGFNHVLKYNFGGAAGTIATGVGTSHAWTIPLDLAHQVPNAVSGVGTITCETWSGSTLIGTNSISFTTTVPGSIVPSVSIAPSGVGLFNGMYVQGKSQVTVNVNDGGSYSSTISSRYTVVRAGSVVISSSGSNAFTSGLINYSGTITIETTVTDSRGRTAYTSTIITVVAYSNPAITGFNAFRSNADGSTNPQGAYIRITGSASISPINDTNGRLVQLQYKLAGSPTWTTATSNSGSYAPSLDITVDADVNNSFDVRIHAGDYYTYSEQQATVGTAFVMMDFHSSGTGMALGKVAETPGILDIAIPVHFDGIQGYIVESGSNVNGTYIKFGDGTMICRGKFEVTLAGASSKANLSVAYPVAFIDTDVVLALNPYGLNGDQASFETDAVNCSGRSNGSTYFGAYIRYTTGTVTYSVNISFLAIGRWK